MTASDGKPEVPAEETSAAVEAVAIEDIEAAEAEAAASSEPATEPKQGFSATWLVAFVILPVLALLFGAAAGYLKWEDSSRRDADRAAAASVAAAKDSTIALLSYKPETVDKDLGAARDRLTGSFLDAYTQLVNTVVIPGAKEKKISAQASVPAAASVSAKPDHAVVLLFVDQTVVVGNDAPTNTASSVRVTLDKVGERWLISGFDPI